MSRLRLSVAALMLSFFVATAGAQAPVPAAPAAPAQTAPAAAAPAIETTAALQLLQAVKAANEETLRRQAATLQQLEELEKAVDQLKIFSKRG